MKLQIFIINKIRGNLMILVLNRVVIITSYPATIFIVSSISNIRNDESSFPLLSHRYVSTAACKSARHISIVS